MLNAQAIINEMRCNYKFFPRDRLRQINKDVGARKVEGCVHIHAGGRRFHSHREGGEVLTDTVSECNMGIKQAVNK